jgi:hypothetical protein
MPTRRSWRPGFGILAGCMAAGMFSGCSCKSGTTGVDTATPSVQWPMIDVAVLDKTASNHEIISAVDGKGPGNREPPAQGDNSRPVEVAEEDGVIINDTYSIAELSYAGTQRPIYVSKNFKIAHGLTPPKDTDLSRYTFYVSPYLLVAEEALLEASNNRVKMSDNQWSMHFEAATIDKGVKEAAAQAILARYPNSRITVGNIALITPRRLGVIALTGGKVYVFSEPLKLVRVEEKIPVYIKGDKALLDALVDAEATLTVRYQMAGYRVLSQDVLHFYSAALVNIGYHHFLTGAAKFELLAEHRKHGTRLDISGVLGPGVKDNTVQGGDKTHIKSSVTRNQVRQVVEAASEYTTTHLWTENQRPDEKLPEYRTRLLDDLLRRAQAREVKINREWAETTGMKGIAPDLAPDQLTDLRTKVNERWKKDNQMKVSGEYEGFKASVDASKRDDDGIDWDWGAKGTVTVPKSILVYQFNEAAFQDIVQGYHANSQARWSVTADVEEPVIFTRNIPAVTATDTLKGHVRRTVTDSQTTGNVARITAPGAGLVHKRGDRDVDSKGGHKTTVQFWTTTRFTDDAAAVEVYYRVQEEVSDWTEFAGAETYQLKRTKGLRIITRDPTGDVRKEQSEEGKFRTLDNVVGGDGKYVRNVKLLVDSPEDNDSPFVGYEFDFEIPCTVEMEPARVERSVFNRTSYTRK